MIVSEASCNWVDGSKPDKTISRLFEEIISINESRGYGLHSWQLSRVSTVINDVVAINETIVAVFK